MKIESEDTSNNNFFRYARLQIGSGPYFPSLPALGSKIIIHNEMIHEASENRLVECYLKITKEKLDEMDSDRESQREFIENNFANAYGGNFFIIPKILLREGDTFTDHEMQYLVNLLSFPGNFIPVAPLFYIYDLTDKGHVSIKKAIDEKNYFQLIGRLLDKLKSDSSNTVGLMVQSNISASKIPELLKLYKDFSTPISFLDGSGRSCIDDYLQIRTLTKEPNTYNLREKHGENFMLYSFDSKPYRGKGDITPAINILQYNAGFSSFGPRHTVRNRPIPPPPPNQERLPYIPRIFYKEHFAYSKHEVQSSKDSFLSWLRSNQIEVEDRYESYVKRYHKDYEYENLLNSTKELAIAAAKEGVDSVLGSINEVSAIVKKIKRNNQLVDSQF